MDRPSFVCAHCLEKFARKDNLKRHIKVSCSKRINFKKKKSICYICKLEFTKINGLDDHLKSSHNIGIKICKLSFASNVDFIEWKEQEESATRSEFVKRNGPRRNSNNDVIAYYYCNRRGEYRSENNGKRMARSKGSSKIGFYCSARIFATFRNGGQVSVTYQSTHTGHDHQFCYLRLPVKQEQLIATKIAEGENLDHILNEIRNEIGASSTLQKKHFINRKTLLNIMSKYGIPNSGQYHKADCISVDLLVEETKNLEPNPILVYKKQGETHDILGTDEMMIVIMTSAQAEILKKFGSNKVCIDSTNETATYDLQLTTIMVIDEFGEGFPGCFCISNQVNEITLSVLFRAIKGVIGTISADIFMSDDAPFFYCAWKSIMGEVNSQLLCKWYVDHAWVKHLNLLPNKRAKCEVYATLMLILEEPDEEEFYRLMESFLQKLHQENCDEFRKFFFTNYHHRPKVWAACYRSKACSDSSVALEAFHRVLKHLYLKVRKNNRIDVLMKTLFKILRDKVFKRLICLEEEYVNHYMNKVSKRHRLSKEIHHIEAASANEWHVKSVGTKKLMIYTVRHEEDVCQCKQKCFVCNVCVHMYSCNCHDYMITHNLCKHIHAVVMRFLQPDMKKDYIIPVAQCNVINCDDQTVIVLDEIEQEVVTMEKNDIVPAVQCNVIDACKNEDPKIMVVEELEQVITLLKNSENSKIIRFLDKGHGRQIKDMLSTLCEETAPDEKQERDSKKVYSTFDHTYL